MWSFLTVSVTLNGPLVTSVSGIVDRLQSERRQRALDGRRVALRVHQRDALAVQNGVGKQRLVVGRKPRVDQPLPCVDEVLGFDRGSIPVLRRTPQVEHVGGA